MKTKKESVSPVLRYALPVLYGTAVGLLVCLAVLLVMAIVLTVQDMPVAAASYLSVVALGLGALGSGFVGAKKAGAKGLLWGSVCGLLLFVIFILIGFSFFQDVQGTSLWFRLAIAVLCGAIGGVLGINTRKR